MARSATTVGVARAGAGPRHAAQPLERYVHGFRRAKAAHGLTLLTMHCRNGRQIDLSSFYQREACPPKKSAWRDAATKRGIVSAKRRVLAVDAIGIGGRTEPNAASGVSSAHM